MSMSVEAGTATDTAGEAEKDPPSNTPEMLDASGEVKDPTEGMDLAQQLEHWKRVSRKHEARAKENFEKAKRLDELEQAQKTELEKAQERAAKAEQELAQARTEALRASMAAKYQVPLSLLSGTDEETLLEQVKALQEYGKVPAATPAQGAAGKQGENINSDKQQITSREALRSMSPDEILKATKDGRLNDLLQGKP